ncbi:hypothetical protein NDN08_004425 [Rhodosorus marinus]|uniref:Aminotransferase class V domain-containing protein n=1 Tax=Rhodosorus marinus TaxID=101924 RepID=A0AAV8UPS9_9RHOD|nr:hypothetical protein NDN08_004425 [Rhodosorus marinus]
MKGLYAQFTQSMLEPVHDQTCYDILGVKVSPPAQECTALGGSLRRSWFMLGEGAHLSHGAYGAASVFVQNTGDAIRAKMEEDPVRFFYELLFPALSLSLRRTAQFVSGAARNMAFVPNVEFAISAALQSLAQIELFPNGCKILVTSLTYGAVKIAAKEAASRKGGWIDVVEIPTCDDCTDEEILRRFRGKLRGSSIAVFEHISSPTGLVMPVEEICKLCREHSVLSVVDGAHSLGAAEVNLERIRADVYTSNGHKWLMNQRGCAFLAVSEQVRDVLHPVLASWGHDKGFNAEFVWQGTMDYTPMLTMPAAISFLTWCGRGNPEQVYRRNHRLACWAADMLSYILDTKTLFPSEMVACMACVKLPVYANPIEELRLVLSQNEPRVQVAVFFFVVDNEDDRYLRISCAIYNDVWDVLTLAKKLLDVIRAPEEAHRRLRRKEALVNLDLERSLDGL